MCNSHFELSDLYYGLANWYTRPIFPPFIWPITGFPIAISDHHLKYSYIHTISQRPRIRPKGMLNAVTRNAWIGWDRACQYIALITADRKPVVKGLNASSMSKGVKKGVPSALARGSESGIYSHKVQYVRTYVRTYVRGGSRSGMSHGMSLHTIDVGHTQGLIHSDTLDSDIDGVL